MQIKKIYKCEICGFESMNKGKVANCESRGIPKPLLKVGDTIYFKECKETQSIPNRKSFDSIRDIVKEDNLYDKLLEFTVSEINICRHNIEYILDGNDSHDYINHSGNFSKLDKSDPLAIFKGCRWIYHFPTIEGNGLMQKVLDLYNKGDEH